MGTPIHVWMSAASSGSGVTAAMVRDPAVTVASGGGLNLRPDGGGTLPPSSRRIRPPPRATLAAEAGSICENGGRTTVVEGVTCRASATARRPRCVSGPI